MSTEPRDLHMVPDGDNPVVWVGETEADRKALRRLVGGFAVLDVGSLVVRCHTSGITVMFHHRRPAVPSPTAAPPAARIAAASRSARTKRQS